MHVFQCWKQRGGRWIAIGLQEGMDAESAGRKALADHGVAHLKLTPIGPRSIRELGYTAVELSVTNMGRIARKSSQRPHVGPKGRSKISLIRYENGEPFKGS